MSNNFELFRDLINQENLYMEEGRNEDGSSFFRVEQRLKSGGSVILAVNFYTNDDLVEIYVFNIAEIRDAYKKETALKLINELNREYRYSKFTLENDSVNSTYCMMFEDNFNPSLVLRQLILALNSAEDAYPKFMKVAWA
ncbi:YbjN domain-containing protein [Fictibacillus sp. b24]|uniref:YbjN domain-containing protein n=1 Tax=Fictibacillus sp. b24 TaxID=3055863 RepID=UPI0025A1967B|nr:YbjN domain-containing protein [Fictibacillus sp. b24]MDM5314920.1 YbjN domain-containing protein [Fictibacillus sp. b24]